MTIYIWFIGLGFPRPCSSKTLWHCMSISLMIVKSSLQLDLSLTLSPPVFLYTYLSFYLTLAHATLAQNSGAHVWLGQHAFPFPIISPVCYQQVNVLHWISKYVDECQQQIVKKKKKCCCHLFIQLIPE